MSENTDGIVEAQDKRRHYHFICEVCRFTTDVKAGDFFEAVELSFCKHNSHHAARGCYCAGDSYDIRES